MRTGQADVRQKLSISGTRVTRAGRETYLVYGKAPSNAAPRGFP
jgi:hypothetical protein